MSKKIFYYFFISGICLLAFLSSCSQSNVHKTKIEDRIFYPSPPDTARIQFLTRYNKSIDFTGQQSRFVSFVVGPEKVLPILKPYGICIKNNKIYVVDAAIGGLQIINLKEKTFEYFIPEGGAKLKIPINCFVDENDDLYISDVQRRQVIIFDRNLEYKGEIGGSSNFKPTDLSIKGDTLYITDPLNNRVNAYNKTNRQLLFTFPTEAKVGEDNWLYNPTNLHIAFEKIYITDFGQSRIKQFTLDGKFLSSHGGYGTGYGNFVRPKGISVDNEQILYVVDAGFQNVQMFNKENKLLMFFGGPYKGPGDMYLPAKVAIDYDHLSYFEEFVDPAYELKYLIFVTNQYGPDKISVYGRIEPK